MSRLATLSAALAVFGLAASSPARRQEESYAGYLISTFSDATPQVQWHLSNDDSPSEFTFTNGGQPILTSTVGTGGVRDVFLTTNSARSEYHLIATDLDINADGFTWDWAVRHGSLGLVIWTSTNLVDWSEPSLRIVEASTAGMAWAPSAVWDDAEGQYYVFWASCHYDASDTGHNGTGTLNRIRYATTQDFVTFSEPSDYVSDPTTGLIDQEFQYLGTPGSYVRFLKNETLLQVYQETTTDGIFGSWTRTPGYVTEGSPYEGPASFVDINDSDVYYLLLDNYEEYVPFTTSSILGGAWEAAGLPNFPTGLKHGSVLPVTQTEYDLIVEKYL